MFPVVVTFPGRWAVVDGYPRPGIVRKSATTTRDPCVRDTVDLVNSRAFFVFSPYMSYRIKHANIVPVAVTAPKVHNHSRPAGLCRSRM